MSNPGSGATVSPRVAIVTSLLPPEQGGPALQSAGLAKYLAAAGIEVDLLLLGPQLEVEAGCRTNLYHHVLRPCRIPGLYHLIAFWHLLLHLLRRRPTLVHTQVFGDPTCIAAVLACRLLGIPAYSKVSSEPGVDRVLKDARAPRTANLLRHVGCSDWLNFKLCDRVLVTTKQFRRIISVKYGIDHRRVLWMPNFTPIAAGAKVRTQEVPDGVHRLVSVARGIRAKNFDGCIRVAGRMRRAGVSFHWHFIGRFGAGYREELARLAATEGVADAISFEGRLGIDRIAELLKGASLFVLLSWFEWFGIAVAEAMAMGVPVVVSKVPGMAEVPGSAGVLVNPEDCDAVAKQLVDLLADPERRARMGRAALDRVRTEYSIERTGSLLLGWIQQESDARRG